MHNGQGWIAWGLAEEAPAMVRMYTLTQDSKYVEYFAPAGERLINGLCQIW
jgi:hypothetical protein